MKEVMIFGIVLAVFGGVEHAEKKMLATKTSRHEKHKEKLDTDLLLATENTEVTESF